MRPVLQIRLVKRPTSLISSDQLCQLSNFIRPVCHAMRLGLCCSQGCGVGVWSRRSRMFSAGVGVGTRFSKLLESESGVGFSKLLESESVFQNCWSRSRFFKTAGVGVGFSKLLESESVFQNCWSRNICCNYRLQCLLNNLNYNINCLKIITGFWQY